MIATLSGELKRVEGNLIVIEVGGVGYEACCPKTTLEVLPAVGGEVFIHTHLHVREDEMRLFGFATAEEKRLFLLLVSLPKVGVRTALDILSTFNVNDLRQIVLKQDLARMTKVPGVGRKSAERILFELKERLEKLPEPTVPHRVAAAGGDRFDEAVQGLVYLGCKYSVAVKAIQQAVDQLGGDAPVEDLIREGLKYR